MKKNFHIYKSSAGSGKTYTLVKEYLKIVLLDPGKVRNILAITFTNAAAAEMKERIIEELSQLKSLKEHPSHEKARSLLEQIMTEVGKETHKIPSEEALIANAGIVLKGILHRYSDFSVSTIDSFVHRVIRTFSFDLFLPFHFEVELDAESLLAQATDTLISRSGVDKSLTEILISFILNQADEEKDLRIEKQIIEMGKTLMDEDGTASLEKLKDLSLDDFRHIAKTIKTAIKEYENEVRQVSEDAMAMIHQQHLSASDFFQAKNGIYGYLNKLASGLTGEKVAPGSNVMKTLEEDKWVSGKADPASKAAIQTIKEQLRETLNRITGSDMEKINLYKVYTAIGKNIYPVAILNELEKVLEGIKSENVLLHISDFNKKIAAIVAEQPVPFIYERLGERYQHYMIDEFQDTSGLQWQNLIPLVDNALAEGRMSLVVGDGKQAIYRFRNGDVEQFAALPKLTPAIKSVAKHEWERNLEANEVVKNLGTNYRSSQEIVSFNNAFFKLAKNHLSSDLQPIYKETEQSFLTSKTGGLVEITFIDPEETKGLQHTNTSLKGKEDQKPFKDGLTGDFNDEEGDPSYETATLDHIINTIERIQNAGHILSDITVLCRAHKEASMVARTLLENQIPVISSESLLLDQSDEVNFIVSIFKLLSNQTDQIAAVEMLGYLCKHNLIHEPNNIHDCLKETGLYARPTNNESKWLLPALEKLLNKNGLPFSFQEFVHQNMYDICETIIRNFFAGQCPPNPFVAFFSDAVFDYSEKNQPSVNDFLEWWEEKSKKFSLVVPAGIEAIQIMTIHKSKGLQFPVVIMPFASHSYSRLTKSGQWVNTSLDQIPELTTSWIQLNKALLDTPFETCYTHEKNKSFLDALNMTYVAFTRAIDKLFILTKKAKSYNNNNTHGLLYHYLKEKNIWNEDQNTYTFGTMPSGKSSQISGFTENAKSTINDTTNIPAHKASKTYDTPIRFNSIPSQPWSRVLRMKSHQTERNPVAGSHDYLERGNLLHRAMENIYTPHDITPVLKQMLANGEIDQQKMAEWEEKIRQLLGKTEIAPYYSEGLTFKSEAGIFDAEGNFFRPDRVVIIEDQVIIIDYKTGKQYSKHESQMELYGSLLMQMGYSSVKKFILYLDENYVKSV